MYFAGLVRIDLHGFPGVFVRTGSLRTYMNWFSVVHSVVRCFVVWKAQHPILLNFPELGASPVMAQGGFGRMAKNLVLGIDSTIGQQVAAG